MQTTKRLFKSFVVVLSLKFYQTKFPKVRSTNEI